MAHNPCRPLRGVPLPDIVVASGSVVGLAGPNGAGKSTLLNVLAFLKAPATGEIYFEGRPVTTEGQRQVLRRKVTLLLQHPVLLKRGVLDNVAYGLKIRGVKQGREDMAREALEQVGLDPDKFGHRPWRELSGGEAQRVALAARLVLKPTVLLLDEPTASLDVESAERIKGAVASARERGATMVVASHDRAWLNSIADRIVDFSPPAEPVTGQEECV